MTSLSNMFDKPTLYFFNDRKPGIYLVKVDSADPSKVIPNAKFSIEAVDGSFGPAEFTTDQNGEIDLSEAGPWGLCSDRAGVPAISSTKPSASFSWRPTRRRSLSLPTPSNPPSIWSS